MMKLKLKNHPYSKCHVELYEGIEKFISYETVVLVTDLRSRVMEVNGLYSMTTRRQISWYLMEYFSHIPYKKVKEAYEKDMNININNGELIEK